MSKNGRLTCAWAGGLARTVETPSPPGERADLVAQPTTARAMRTAPNHERFSVRNGRGEITANLGALLVTPPSVWQTVLSKSSCYALGRLGSEMGKVQGLSAVTTSGSASAGRSVSMSMSVTAGRSQDTNAAGDDALNWLSGFRMLRKGGVFDTLFKFVPLWRHALLGWNRFVDVSRHREVMSCGRFMTRIFVVAMHASGVHLQPTARSFRRLL